LYLEFECCANRYKKPNRLRKKVNMEEIPFEINVLNGEKGNTKSIIKINEYFSKESQ
jgi:hypothetical protein